MARSPHFDTDDYAFEDWLNRYRPTTTPSNHGPWLTITHHSVPRPRITPQMQFLYEQRLAECEVKCMLKPRHKTEFRNQAKQEILELARTNRDLAGKWIIFPFQERVDEVWAQVADAVLRNELGPSAKVATTPANNPPMLYPICVYVKSWDDKEDVKRVLRKLQGMGIVKRTKEDKDLTRMVASFKPDVFTRVGMYHRDYQSGCKIDPVLYRIEDFEI